MAEAMFGISEELKQKALSKIPSEFVDVLNVAYNRLNKISNTDLLL